MFMKLAKVDYYKQYEAQEVLQTMNKLRRILNKEYYNSS